MARAFTPEEHETVRKLWLDGLSSGLIGARLGRSGKSIRGKAARMKLPVRCCNHNADGALLSRRPRESAGFWTPERVETLRRLWAEGVSSGLIAEELGSTRNMIVGKVNRLGLAKRPTAVGIKGPQRMKGQGTRKKDRAERKARKVVKLRTRLWEATDLELMALPPDSSADAVPFLERRSFQCAWPLWTDSTPQSERTCCGSGSIPESPYCLRHARMAYAAPGSRRPVQFFKLRAA